MIYIIQTYYVYCKNFQYDEKTATNDLNKAIAYVKSKLDNSFTDSEIEDYLVAGEDLMPPHSWGGNGAKIETVEEL